MSAQDLIQQSRFDSVLRTIKQQKLSIPSATVGIGVYQGRDARTGLHSVQMIGSSKTIKVINLGLSAKGKGGFLPSVTAQSGTGFCDYKV